MTEIRLLLVDDHAVVRTGLRMLLENEEDMLLVGEAGSGAKALDLAAELCPDVVIRSSQVTSSSFAGAANRFMVCSMGEKLMFSPIR